MYKFFKIQKSEILKINETFPCKNTYDKANSSINLSSFVADYGKDYLDAEKIWDNCFSTLKEKRIFISHSGKDRNDGSVPKFASVLEKNFETPCFIDYYFWDNIEELQRKLDKKYCISKNDPNYYDYTSRNYSTAHVHSLLSTALTRMIDQCECFIFVQSENSYSVDEAMSGTFSPWIFHELDTVNIIRQKEPSRKKLLSESTAATEALQLKMKYPVNISDWTELYASIFTGLEGKKGEDFLDELYKKSESPIQVQNEGVKNTINSSMWDRARLQ